MNGLSFFFSHTPWYILLLCLLPILYWCRRKGAGIFIPLVIVAVYFIPIATYGDFNALPENSIQYFLFLFLVLAILSGIRIPASKETKALYANLKKEKELREEWKKEALFSRDKIKTFVTIINSIDPLNLKTKQNLIKELGLDKVPQFSENEPMLAETTLPIHRMIKIAGDLDLIIWIAKQSHPGSEMLKLCIGLLEGGTYSEEFLLDGMKRIGSTHPLAVFCENELKKIRKAGEKKK